LNDQASQGTPRCCPHYGVCGGCSQQHLPPAEQRRGKQQALLLALWQAGRLEPAHLLPPLHLATPWGYRRKARLGANYLEAEGKALVGFRRVGGHRLAEIDGCPILHPRLSGLILPLRELLPRLSMRGHIPKIEAALGDACAALVFRVMQPPALADLRLLRAFGEQQRVGIELQSCGPASGITLCEPTELEYRLPEYDLSFRFRGDDFIQVNGELNRLLVQRAVELLEPQPEERLLDLFCGLGNFTLPLARFAKEVVGVEGNPALVNRARENARRNGLPNARFHSANLYTRPIAGPWLQASFRPAPQRRRAGSGTTAWA